MPRRTAEDRSVTHSTRLREAQNPQGGSLIDSRRDFFSLGINCPEPAQTQHREASDPRRWLVCKSTSRAGRGLVLRAADFCSI
jgi:hypothetical protein